jgi:hypothetical protein
MGDKKHVAGNKMSVTDFNDPVFYGKSAKVMARHLLTKEFRGPGDTIQRAARDIEKTKGVDANVLMQGWNRDPRPMLVHRWLPLFLAWVEEGFARADAAYETERARHDDNSPLVRLADLVAGRKAEKEA